MDLGRLKPGGVGDVSILRIEEEPVEFVDGDGNAFTGTKYIKPIASVIGGKLWHAT